MNLLSRGLLLTSALLAIFFNLLLPVNCVDKRPLSAPQPMLMEDKVRLGSTPPSCHNRCNSCNPCMAVQVPTLPNPGARADPVLGRRAALPTDDLTSYSSRYSDYKPLGWKCRCGDRLFNP